MRKIVGGALLFSVLLPLMALVPAAAVDRDPAGVPRVSAFPVALVVLDPAVWLCVGNSGLAATAVALGSMGLGLILGTILGRRRFRGRGLLGFLALTPLAIGPIWIAPGVVAAIGKPATWEWLAARSFLGQPADDWARWFALVVTGILGGAPTVILAVRAGMERIEPSWLDAARVVGARRGQVWRDVSWPTIRPHLAAAGALVFTWSLVEPAAPSILGLRRSLAVALSDAANQGPGSTSRAATLAILAIVLAVAVRIVLIRWGGRSLAPNLVAPPTPVARAGRGGGLIAALVLLAWSTCALGPVAWTARRLIRDALGERPLDAVSLRAVAERWLDPDLIAWSGNSVMTATLAVGFDLVVLLGLGTATAARWGSRLAAVPPLALGIGALGIPGLLAAWAAVVPGTALAPVLESIRRELSVGRSPGFLLILVLAAARWPILARHGANGGPTDPAAVDAAVLAGATARGARQLGRSPTRTDGSWALLLVAWTWAATDLASAWNLTPFTERRTLAPAALHLSEFLFDPLGSHLPLNLFLSMTSARLVALACLLAIARQRRAIDWPLTP